MLLLGLFTIIYIQHLYALVSLTLTVSFVIGVHILVGIK